MGRKAGTAVVQRRFAKPRRDLPSILWDRKRDCSRVEFVRGTALVTDEALANELLGMGYIEIPLEQTEFSTPLDAAPIYTLSASGHPVLAPQAPIEKLPPDLQLPADMIGKDTRPGSFSLGD